ncbi:chromosome partitioning protein ParA [Comamonas kerstersii]|uniref:Chromosome partitioning protein ParA n=1 Tax=Comamonas kerstersii TaxID=225992 RepID=A0A6A1R3I3_9BURK|nr:chromosome partitioning protein ParA [Comamonas kerstersii]KAB0587238.1 chromosome partitioning protein ParA [Comamonas kerstersii]
MSKTKKTVKKAAANHILVVAHPSAQAQQVFELLKAAGVQEALPSRREQLSAQALTETLLKAHGLQWHEGQVPTNIESVEASPMWQSLVLDLVLGNMEQPLWAWLDPQAVHLLDFWQQQSEHTVFMLVYDDLHNIYQQCLQSGTDVSPESINAKVQSWVAYNEALLQFHLRNPERSFLVHAKQVAQSAQSYVQQINQRVAAPLELAAGQSTASEEPVDTAEQPISQLASTELQTQPSATTQPSTDGLANWLIEQLVHTQADALQLYEEMQAAANLPLTNVAMSAPAADAAALQQAWVSFAAAQLQHSRNTQRVADLQQQLQTLQQQHAQEQALTDSEATAKQAVQVQLKNAEEENALLLEQLHKVQEELESCYLQSQEQAKKLAEIPKLQAVLKSAQEQASKLQQAEAAAQKLQADLKAAQEKAAKLQQAEAAAQKLQADLKAAQEKAAKLQQTEAAAQKLQADLKAAQEKAAKLQQTEAQLKKELQQAVAKSASAELQEENELLLGQLHKVQEELERYYLENHQLKAKGIAAQSKVYYGAADRVKQQLAYRLGATMIRQSRSIGGWLNMPFALSAETKRFRQDQAAGKDQQLPPIAQYQDAHEAELIKQHLSYRLGARLLTNTKTLGGRISLPWSLYAEVKAYKKDRQSH